MMIEWAIGIVHSVQWSQVLSILALLTLFAVGWWWAIVKRGTWTTPIHTQTLQANDERLAIMTQQHLMLSQQTYTTTTTTPQPIIIGTKKAKKLERKAQRREFTAHQQALRQRDQQAAELAWELDQECRERDRQLQLPQIAILRDRIQAAKEEEQAQKLKERRQLDEEEQKLRNVIGKKAICLVEATEFQLPVLKRLEKEYAVLRDAERVLIVDKCQLEKISERWLERHEECQLDQFVSLCMQLGNWEV